MEAMVRAITFVDFGSNLKTLFIVKVGVHLWYRLTETSSAFVNVSVHVNTVFFFFCMNMHNTLVVCIGQTDNVKVVCVVVYGQANDVIMYVCVCGGGGGGAYQTDDVIVYCAVCVCRPN